MVLGIGACPRIDPLILGDAKRLGFLLRDQNQRRSLIHIVVGIHQFRVGERYRSIRIGDGADFLSRLSLAYPSVGVAGGNVAKASPKLGNVLHMRVDAEPAGVSERGLHDRIDLNRPT